MRRLDIATCIVLVLTLIVWGCETSNGDRSKATDDKSGAPQPEKQDENDETSIGPGPYEYIHSIGTDGDAPGEFKDPVGLAVTREGVLYVSDAGNKRMQKLDEDGKSLTVWADGIGRPMHLSWSKDGYVIAAVFLEDQITLFDDTESARSFGGDWLDAPGGAVQADDGRFYVADFYHHQFHIVSDEGTPEKTIGQKGEGDGEFTYPTDVALNADGQVWIADAYAHRLQKFSPDGEHLLTVGEWGKTPGKFRIATGIDIGPDGRLYVADFQNNRVQVLDADGTPVAVFGTAGHGDALMGMPTDVVAIGERVYVVDHGHHQIDVWSRGKDD